MKRILSSILASTLLLSTLGTSFAQEISQTTLVNEETTEVLQPIETQTLSSGKCGENAYYTFDSATGELIISGTGALDSRPWFSYQQDIKSVVISQGITTIGGATFSGCLSLTSVTIPNSVTEIGAKAFYDCEALESITIGNSVTTIGDYAFNYCSSLTSVNIPNSVTIIGEGAFHSCSSLTSVTIPNSVTEIESYTFFNCRSLTSVTIPNSITIIGLQGFGWCSSLTTITIPDSVTTMGENAFNECTSLESVTIGNSVTTIADSAFYNCKSLTSVTIGNSVTEIGEGAFYNCKPLTSITIPDSVTAIDYNAFVGCSSLTSITIPKSVTSIRNYAFWDCLSLTTVYYAGSEADREEIYIGSNHNSYLKNATWIYNSTYSPAPSTPTPEPETPSTPTPSTPTPEPTPTYAITTTTPSNGTVSLGQSSAEAGERVTFKVTANSGYLIESVSVVKKDGSTVTCGYDWTEGCYAFIMPSETVDITVNFSKIPTVTYTTQLNQTTGGNFSVSTTKPQEGDEVTITTKPNSGYSVSYVTVYTTSGVRVPCINMGNGVYVYKQPSSEVIVTTTFQNVTVATDKFTDITASDWYTAYVAYVTEHGLMNGMGDGLFQPDTATSRAMVALILALASGEEIPVATTQEFPDVPLGEWYSNGISWCKKNGVVSGYENGNFGTNDAITNEQMVVMMKSFAEYQGMDTKNADSSLLLGYADCNDVSFWAEDAYAWALENEYLQIEGNKLSPQDNASRAEFANILNLFLENS